MVDKNTNCKYHQNFFIKCRFYSVFLEFPIKASGYFRFAVCSLCIPSC